ncbi:MAG: hypothetical protein MR421_03185 [Prevotella sp.]|nr:hypothetical protein [Prevotella sp.]
MRAGLHCAQPALRLLQYERRNRPSCHSHKKDYCFKIEFGFKHRDTKAQSDIVKEQKK